MARGYDLLHKIRMDYCALLRGAPACMIAKGCFSQRALALMHGSGPVLSELACSFGCACELAYIIRDLGRKPGTCAESFR